MEDFEPRRRLGGRMKNDEMEVTDDERFAVGMIIAMILGALVFGGIHVAARNFVFPTWIELIFWRCASVFSAALFLLVIIAACLQKTFLKAARPVRIISFLYCVARLFLLVEIFRTLCFLPPEAYISTWTSSIPHIT
jgi:hypothetical protein